MTRREHRPPCVSVFDVLSSAGVARRIGILGECLESGRRLCCGFPSRHEGRCCGTERAAGWLCLGRADRLGLCAGCHPPAVKQARNFSAPSVIESSRVVEAAARVYIMRLCHLLWRLALCVHAMPLAPSFFHLSCLCRHADNYAAAACSFDRRRVQPHPGVRAR